MMGKGASATLEDVLVQMRITNRLLAALLKKELRQIDIVSLLASSGASNSEIADILDTSPATIATTLSRLRKKQGRSY
jgi:DNA-binding CsgD family transcriptional regulator